MANTLRISMPGVAKMAALIDAYGEAVTRAARADMLLAVARTADRARTAAPVLTGDLRNSIRGSVRTDGYTYTGTVTVGVAYAANVEFGTEDTPKHPHLVPAAVDERKQLQERLIANIVDKCPPELGRPGVSSHDSPLPLITIE